MPVHIEPVGGVSGDMFVAAFVDAEPELAPLLAEALARLAAPAELRLEIEPTRNHQIDG
ncbi:MAG: nickel insertion protein, partial [Methyloligellaceae bacterium]